MWKRPNIRRWMSFLIDALHKVDALHTVAVMRIRPRFPIEQDCDASHRQLKRWIPYMEVLAGYVTGTATNRLRFASEVRHWPSHILKKIQAVLTDVPRVCIV